LFSEKSLIREEEEEKKEINASKIYSPVGNLAERAEKCQLVVCLLISLFINSTMPLVN